MGELKAAAPVPMQKVRIDDAFWSRQLQTVRETMLPYQWEALNDRVEGEKSHAVANFRIAAGLQTGAFEGEVFQDSDVAKWLEAVAYSLATASDPELEQLADSVIDLIAKAQQPDGYLDTYFILGHQNQRWSNLYECHELYTMGHMIEAAVAYAGATGKKTLLQVACRIADAVDNAFGPGEGKLHGYPGHQEIELALLRLYKETKEPRYLALARYFLEERGKAPSYFQREWETSRNRQTFKTNAPTPPPDLPYCQAHLPVLDQAAAVGHAVREMYMCTAVAALARESGNLPCAQWAKALWHNVITRQMYITGGVGSTARGEAFTFDYDLPNETAYAESCASVGMVFFAHELQQMDVSSSYGDEMERVLYNLIPASISQDGTRFFYVNPLEVWPEASQGNPDRRHVKPVRQPWFGCACCPPNVARLLASLGKYLYSVGDDTLFVHLYMGSKAEVAMGDGVIQIEQKSAFPWDGKVTLEILSSSAKNPSLAVRIPGWCRRWHACVNGQAATARMVNGYAVFDRAWRGGDRLELEFDMTAEFLWANPLVRADAGKVAIGRGPLVYCLEEMDNGANLSALALDPSAGLIESSVEGLPPEVIALAGSAFRASSADWNNCLYRPEAPVCDRVPFQAIPYFLWGNRRPGEMSVWIQAR